MSGEWKPGDVGVTGNKYGGETPTRFVVIQDATGAPRWVYVDGDSASHGPRDDARPLVVIDPEDEEQLQRLGNALYGAGFTASMRMRAALRSLIADPKPEEPTGLGAVVEDAKGGRWLHSKDAWWSEDSMRTRAYSNIHAVKVLSEGVTASARHSCRP